MRNQALTGYILHQKPYREKQAIYWFFSQECGLIHGVGRRGLPLFECLTLFATGQRKLKTFTQIQLANPDLTKDQTIHHLAPITGQEQYAGFYLNEILWRLLAVENPTPTLWQAYQNSLTQLKNALTDRQLRLCLRQFEGQLLDEMGVQPNLTQDQTQTPIDPTKYYQFLLETGLILLEKNHPHPLNTAQNLPTFAQPLPIFLGKDLLKMAQSGICVDQLSLWSRLYRPVIDYLLEYKPLESRRLWQQFIKYRNHQPKYHMEPA